MQEPKLETRHAIPTGLQILLSELNFLSQIKKNTKPCCGDHVLVDSDSWYGAFYRFRKGENRNNSMSKIEQIVNQTIDAIEIHKNTEHIKIIINYFSEAREGINSLLTVYSDDPDIKARVKVILDIIDIQLSRFKYLIKGFANEDQPTKTDFPGLSESFSQIDLLDSEEKKKPRKRFNKIE